MPDSTTTVAELRERMRQFVAERDWEQFHSPKNLVMGLSVEASELMEHFLWIDAEASRRAADDPATRTAIGEEVADVALYLFALCNTLGLDLSEVTTKSSLADAVTVALERTGHQIVRRRTPAAAAE